MISYFIYHNIFTGKEKISLYKYNKIKQFLNSESNITIIILSSFSLFYIIFNSLIARDKHPFIIAILVILNLILSNIYKMFSEKFKYKQKVIEKDRNTLISDKDTKKETYKFIKIDDYIVLETKNKKIKKIKFYEDINEIYLNEDGFNKYIDPSEFYTLFLTLDFSNLKINIEEIYTKPYIPKLKVFFYNSEIKKKYNIYIK